MGMKQACRKSSQMLKLCLISVSQLAIRWYPFVPSTTDIGKFLVSIEMFHLVQRKKSGNLSKFVIIDKLAADLPERGGLTGFILIPGECEADIDLGLREIPIAGIDETERSSVPASRSRDSKELAPTALDGVRVDIDQTTKLDRQIDMKSEFLLCVGALVEVVVHMTEVERGLDENFRRYLRHKGIEALLSRCFRPYVSDMYALIIGRLQKDVLTSSSKLSFSP